jgi:prepilin-type N-terminal cleavage/methylation domain-containing protein
MDAASRPQRGGRPGSRLGGFTLIEMIVVMGIIVMMASLMGPTLATMFSNRRLENAGTMVSSVLNEARNTAVTQKRRVAVIFCRDGLRTYREPKYGEGTEGFQYLNAMRRYNVDGRGEISYDLHFADLEYEDIPEELGSLVDCDGNIDNPSVGGRDVVLWFDRDGTVDFGEYRDVPTYEFSATPCQIADVEIRMAGSLEICWVDIRATGRTVSKVEEPDGGDE